MPLVQATPLHVGNAVVLSKIAGSASRPRANPVIGSSQTSVRAALMRR